MFDFSKNPRYQKAFLKVARWDPNKRAIFSTAMLDEAFATEEMRRQITLMDLEMRKKAIGRSLTLGRRRIALGEKRLALGAKAQRYGKKQRKIASLIGLGQVGTAALTGYAGLKESQAWNREYGRLSALYGGKVPMTPEEVANTKIRVQNPGGTSSTEKTITIGVDDGYINVPTIWEGKEYSPDEAVKRAFGSGINYPRYRTKEEAVRAAGKRSRAIGRAGLLLQ